MSLSARRAWIEIVTSIFIVVISSVALRKESVDRNGKVVIPTPPVMMSLSARRAWIEIDPVTDKAWALEVALRKESVDRNTDFWKLLLSSPSRSPQGERG